MWGDLNEGRQSPNTYWVGKLGLSTNNSLYLENGTRDTHGL